MRKISVDDPDHAALESRVEAFLQERNFLTTSATYHAVMSKDIQRLLQQRHSPTALYIRTRADRLAVHNRLSVEFEWDAKTASKDSPPNGAFELEPLYYHVMQARTGVDCLYCFHHAGLNYDGGFWCHEVPSPVFISIPSVPHRTSHDVERYRQMAGDVFPESPVRLGGRSKGTGDPYVVIARNDLEALSWTECVDAILQEWNGRVCRKLGIAAESHN